MSLMFVGDGGPIDPPDDSRTRCLCGHRHEDHEERGEQRCELCQVEDRDECCMRFEPADSGMEDYDENE